MSHQDIRFRLARAADSQSVAALHAASWKVHYRGSLSQAYLDGPIDADRAALWSQRLAGANPRQIVVLAEAAGDLVGFACALLHQDPVWGTLIDNLHVRVDQKGRGLGRGVVGQVASLLETRAAAAPVHLFVLVDNVAAQGFYERIGGRPVEREDHLEPDGASHPVIRYAWDSPAALLAGTQA